MLQKHKVAVNGVETVYHRGGTGTPLVVLHGFTTMGGLSFAQGWCDAFDVIVPYHPGFGESGDPAAMDDIHDCVMHYVGLLDALDLETVDLVGCSLGGHIAVRLAAEHAGRVRRLVLAGPTGLRVEAHPGADVVGMPPGELIARLFDSAPSLKQQLLDNSDPDEIAARYREATNTARLLWAQPFDRKINRYIHRLRAETLVLWGADDKIVPASQLDAWLSLIPHASGKVIPGAGHLMFNESEEARAIAAAFLEGDLTPKAVAEAAR